MTNPFDGKTAGERDFLVEYTRRRLVVWAARLQTGMQTTFPPDEAQVWKDVAAHKKWLRKDGTDLTAAGYKTAAAFLRR